MELGGDKLSNFRLGKFVGKAEKWPQFRDGLEAFLWALNLGDVLITQRPVPAIPAPVVGAGGVAAPDGGAGGGGAPEGAGAGVAPVVAPVVPAGPDPGELWDLKNAKIFYYLLVYTEGAPQSVVSQFRATRDGAAAWNGLKEKYDPQGSFGKSILHKQFSSLRLDPHTRDPDDYFLEIDRCNARLAELDSAYPEDTLVGIIVSRLPRSVYGSIIGILDNTEDLTYDELKTKVRKCYLRYMADNNPGKGDGSTTKALLGDTKKKGPSGSAWKAKVRCYGCNRFGHFKSECPDEKKDSKSFNADSSKQKNSKGKGSDTKQSKKNRSGGDKEEADGVDNTKFAYTTFSGSPCTWPEVDESRLITFIVDSGATEHMICEERYAVNVKYQSKGVTVAGGKSLPSIGYGDVHVIVKNHLGREVPVVITDVLIIPALGVNLLSVAKLSERDIHVSFKLDYPYMSGPDNSRVLLEYRGGLYRWVVKPDLDVSAQPVAFTAVSSEVVHKRLLHRVVSPKVLSEDFSVKVVPKDPEGTKCDVCELAKHKRISFPKETEWDPDDLKPFETVYVDYVGPIEVPSLSGARYAVNFVDKLTGWMYAEVVVDKSTFPLVIRNFVADIKALGHHVESFASSDPSAPLNIWDSEGRMEELRSDRGGEFISEELLTYCRNVGIRHSFTGPYAPQQLGMAERRNGVLFSMVRSALFQSRLPKYFWGEALNTSVHIANRLPIADRVSPFEAVYGRKPNLDHLRVFGCKAFVHEQRVKKLDPRAWIGIHVGYDPYNWRCYRVYNPATATVRLTIHVSFDENSFPIPDPLAGDKEDDEYFFLDPERDQDIARISTTRLTGGGTAPGIGLGGAIGAPAPEPVAEPIVDPPPQPPMVFPLLDRNATLIDPVALFIGIEPFQEVPRWLQSYALAAIPMSIFENPKSYRQAMASDQTAEWKAAMDKEIDSLMKNETWVLTPLPEGESVIGSRWVYTMKRDGAGNLTIHKARFVAQGFTQRFGENVFETYSPVMKMTSFRLVMAIVAVLDLICKAMDVNTAFLYAPIDEVIFVEQPEGFRKVGPKGEKLVCQMKRSLYGLKQSPRNWNQVIDAWLTDYGLIASSADPCVYVKRKDGSLLIVMLWVDDLIICGNNAADIDHFKETISKRFDMKDLGDLSNILGLKVIRDRPAKILEINQEEYIDEVLQRFGMTDCKPVGTPAEGHLERCPNGDVSRDYMSLVGSLLYAAMVTRLDIAFAVQALCRHLQSSSDAHWTAGKRILRYLKGTKDIGLVYGKSEHGITLKGFADADWATDKDTRRSVTGYVFELGGAAITWNSKLQPTVALSTSEAEYMAACAATQEAIHLRRLLGDLGFPQEGPTVILEDNMGCICLSENPVMHRRTKHIDIKFHFIREAVERGDVVLTFTSTSTQVADLLTKPLPKARTQKLRDYIMGYMKDLNAMG